MEQELLSRIEDPAHEPVFSNEELEKVREALRWAKEMHAPQVRDDGTPYFNHLVEVALIAVEHHQNAKTVVAAILHDIVEDTPVTLEEVRSRFGDDVATIVEGVTKAEKAHFDDPDVLKAATYQNLFLAAVTRPESLTVKLCDRLHNCRTFGNTSREKAVRKAKETLDIYAPLAYSLSHHYIYRELEDICFEVLYPDEIAEIRRQRDMVLSGRINLLQDMALAIGRVLEPYNVHVEHKIRRKHLASLLRKTEEGTPVGSLHDVLSLVLIVEKDAYCYLTLGALHHLYRPAPGHFKDYISLPKGNGYRSLHSVVYHPSQGVLVEVQIRTPQMAHAAEWGTFESARDWIERERPVDPVAFFASVKRDLFRDEIYLFDTEGKATVVPRGTTAKDWLERRNLPLAEVEANGQIIEPDTVLRNGMVLRIVP